MDIEHTYFDHTKKYDQDYEEEYDLYLAENEVTYLIFHKINLTSPIYKDC